MSTCWKIEILFLLRSTTLDFVYLFSRRRSFNDAIAIYNGEKCTYISLLTITKCIKLTKQSGVVLILSRVFFNYTPFLFINKTYIWHFQIKYKSVETKPKLMNKRKSLSSTFHRRTKRGKEPRSVLLLYRDPSKKSDSNKLSFEGSTTKWLRSHKFYSAQQVGHFWGRDRIFKGPDTDLAQVA